MIFLLPLLWYLRAELFLIHALWHDKAMQYPSHTCFHLLYLCKKVLSHPDTSCQEEIDWVESLLGYIYTLFLWPIFWTQFYQGGEFDFEARQENLGHIVLKFYPSQLILSSGEHITLHLTQYLLLQSVEEDRFRFFLLATDTLFKKKLVHLYYVFCVYFFKMLQNFLTPLLHF